MNMLLILILSVIIILVNSITTTMIAPQSKSQKDDGTYCLLYQRVPRDPVAYHNAIKLKRSQKCKLNLLGGGNAANFNYRLNTQTIPVLDTANAIITKNNLDLGTKPPLSGLIYAKKLGGGELSNTVAGQVLGSSLGGNGVEITNIIPMAVETQAEYIKFETTIHDCLANSKADSASLQWTLLYRQTSDSRPFKITYRVQYHNGIEECKSTSKIFLN